LNPRRREPQWFSRPLTYVFIGFHGLPSFFVIARFHSISFLLTFIGFHSDLKNVWGIVWGKFGSGF